MHLVCPIVCTSVTVRVCFPSLCMCVWLATAPCLSCRASTIFFICCSFFFLFLLFFSPSSSSLFALGNTMSGLISFSNHWRLQGKDFWLGCFVPANTKERGEKIITLVVDNSCSDHSAVICLWCLSVAAADVVFCFVALRFTELHHYYKLSDTLRLLHVHLRYMQHHLVFTEGEKHKSE